MGGNLREWTWDWYDSRTYEYEWKETFNDANGYYDLVDEANSTSVFSPSLTRYLPGIAGDGAQVKTDNNLDGTNWVQKKIINLLQDSNVSGVINELYNEHAHIPYSSECKIKFVYTDGNSSQSSVASNGSTSWVSQTYVNPETTKLVTRIEVWLRHTWGANSTEAVERNTLVLSADPSNNSCLTFNIPQYSEQNATHFRVKVDAVRQGDDDVWFELVNEDNSTKTYTNADFDKLLPMQAPIVKPTRLRIYMKPASSGAIVGGTAVSAVYWGTSNPKSLWTASERVVKDQSYDLSLGTLKSRITNRNPSHILQIRGFRLVRRP